MNGNRISVVKPKLKGGIELATGGIKFGDVAAEGVESLMGSTTAILEELRQLANISIDARRFARVSEYEARARRSQG
jgi:hypothetical protein